MNRKNNPSIAASRPEYQPLNLGSGSEMNMNSDRDADTQGIKIVEINRLLASNQYGIGKQIEEFTNNFLKSLEEDKEFKNPAKYVSLLYIVQGT